MQWEQLYAYTWVSWLTGIIVSVVVGHYCISFATFHMQCEINNEKNPWGWHPQIIGIIERILYLIALVLNYPELIGAWLVLKVAAKWNSWEDNDECNDECNDLKKQRHVARARYNIFLIGNGLSLLFVINGMMTMSFIQKNSIIYTDALLLLIKQPIFYIIILTIILTLGIGFIAKQKIEVSNRHK